MSGIFGVVGTTDARSLDEMGHRLRHRGPACAWQEVAPGVYLGACAAQPVAPLRSGPVTTVVDVAEMPMDAQAQRDSLVDRWLQDGIDGLKSNAAAFAFAAWDDSTRSLLLGRDAVGLRPLYFARLPDGRIAFATEYKALLAIPEMPAEPDLDAIQYFQHAKLMPGMQNLLRHVRSAPPGTVLQIRDAGPDAIVQRMTPLALAITPVSENDACRELGARFMTATHELVAGRSQVAVAVSGGIDSIGVAYACRKAAPDAEFLGFTVGHGPDDPEMRTAALVMERLGGRHEQVTVTSRSLTDRLPALVWHLENPIGRSEALQFLELGAAAARQRVTTLFSGFWADALFAGMPRHKVMWLAGLLPPFRRDLLEYYALVTLGRPVTRPVARILRQLTFKAVADVPRIEGASYRPALPEIPEPGPEFLNRFLLAGAAENASRSLMRITMPLAAHGIDVVSPFLSRSVMDYAFSIPGRMKIRRGKEKYILRRALRSMVPPDLVQFPKFPMRMHYDDAFAATLNGSAAQYLSDDSIRARGFFTRAGIGTLLESRRKGRYSPEGAMRVGRRS